VERKGKKMAITIETKILNENLRVHENITEEMQRQIQAIRQQIMVVENLRSRLAEITELPMEDRIFGWIGAVDSLMSIFLNFEDVIGKVKILYAKLGDVIGWVTDVKVFAKIKTGLLAKAQTVLGIITGAVTAIYGSLGKAITAVIGKKMVLKIKTGLLGVGKIIYKGILGALIVVKGILKIVKAALLAPITLIVLAIGGLILAVQTLMRNWDTIGPAIGNILRGIANVFITVINTVIRGIELLAKAALAPINLVIRGINLIPGVNVPQLSLSIPRIPKLATGAVIPPNNEFLAILGDQRSGTNIETPERLLRQIMREELGVGGRGGDIYVTACAQIGEDEFRTATVKAVRLEENRIGTALFAS